jgi:nucleotide-binding universal stress UspA family protein
MRKILVPIANFETAQASLDWAAKLSASLGADLTILHTFSPPSRSHLGSNVTSGKLAEWGIDPPHFRLLQQAQDYLQKEGIFELDAEGKPVEKHSLKALAQGLYEVHLLGAKEQNIRFRLREGSAAREVLDEVNDPLYDLIVMGTRGHRGLKRFLVGSLAQEVALSTPCSILVAKNLKSELGVLVGVTGRETSLEAARQAAQISDALGNQLTLMAIASDESTQELPQTHINEAIEFLGSEYKAIKTKIQIGEPTTILLEETGENNILVLGRAQRSTVKDMFLGDLSLKILDQSKGPVLLTSYPRPVQEPELETSGAEAS